MRADRNGGVQQRVCRSRGGGRFGEIGCAVRSLARAASSSGRGSLRGGRMRNRYLKQIAWVFAVVMVAVPLWAHHGNAAFASDKRVTMKGTVTEWFWANPHCFLQF